MVKVMWPLAKILGSWIFNSRSRFSEGTATIICFPSTGINTATMSFCFEHFVGMSFILFVTIFMCKASLQSVTTKFTEGKKLSQTMQRCRRFQEFNVWKDATKTDRQADALWRAITRPRGVAIWASMTRKMSWTPRMRRMVSSSMNRAKLVTQNVLLVKLF